MPTSIPPSGHPRPEATPPPSHPTGSTPSKTQHSYSGDRIDTLDDLKNYIISKLGEKDGKKLYDSFFHSLVFAMLQETKDSAKRATEAIKRARQQQ